MNAALAEFNSDRASKSESLGQACRIYRTPNWFGTCWTPQRDVPISADEQTFLLGRLRKNLSVAFPRDAQVFLGFRKVGMKT
jgi:hypothetical protein